jgi:hypothetical protein
MTRRRPRHGFAMLTVLVFFALLMTMATVSQRQIASAVRLERARDHVRNRDEGSTRAVALGLDLLETGLPPTSPYACGVTLDTSLGTRSFTVTFTDQAGGTWTVEGRPTLAGENPPSMPASFAL